MTRRTKRQALALQLLLHVRKGGTIEGFKSTHRIGLLVLWQAWCKDHALFLMDSTNRAYSYFIDHDGDNI